ncbi:N-6 DNA methylase [Amycolatopsis sp. NPDC052450]|uniref:N-6 DNA methylase n=1 Tax=Amycolatopsis sp. NPDC052450 TaxID=3363937 RepID=UPI0037C7A407
METIVTKSRAADVVDRLWRTYVPFQRGRNTFGDLGSMLAILILARFVESEGGPSDEFVKRWARAVTEARIGHSPLIDLRAAMMNASGHARFPVPDLRDFAVGRLGGDEESDDIPWAAAFLVALEERPTLDEAGLSEVCELLLERHVQESTVSVGEFYTPRAVARLLIELASPQPGDRILDPACGSGGLLAAAAERIAGSGRVDGASFEAYATDRSNPRLAMMNLAVHGVDRPVVRASDPLSLFHGRNNGLVDLVVSNPPFNQRVEDIDREIWPFGQPSASNANFAWLQLAWNRLSEGGTATMIMPPRAAWSDGREAEIRKRMIARGVLLGIIALPPNLFPHTSIPVHIWMLARHKSRHLPEGEADAVLFIDASRLGTQVPRQPRVLTAEDKERISGRLDEWRRSPRATPDEPGFSRSVTHEEILENDGSLDPRLYVEVEEERSTAQDVNRMLDELVRHDGVTADSSAGLVKNFNRCERLTRSGFEPPRVPLGSIMSGGGEGVVEGVSPGLLIAGPSGSLIRAEDYVDTSGVPVVMPKDLTGNGFSVANIRYITERQAENLERFRLRCGDIVLARRGELGRCAVVREEQQGWLCGTGCFMLRPPAGLNVDYLAAYLRSPEARKWLEAHSTGGMTMKTISLNVLGELPVVLPDLGTQQVIADAMMRLDEHERLLREQLVLTQKIRRDALTGFFPS